MKPCCPPPVLGCDAIALAACGSGDAVQAALDAGDVVQLTDASGPDVDNATAESDGDDAGLFDTSRGCDCPPGHCG